MLISLINPINNSYSYKTLSIKAANSAPSVTSASELPSVPVNSAFLHSLPNVTFTGSKMISLEEQLQRVDFNVIPKRVQDRIQEELTAGTTKNLYEIHTETYAPLLECETLDEAKAKFPEFQGVIDAKDLSEDKMLLTMRKIKQGKFDNIKIEDLSLELLKSHYGRGLSPSHYKEAFFGFSKETIFNSLKALNIERLDGQYLFLISASSPERRAKNSAAWTDEKRAARSAQVALEWEDEEKRRLMSEKKKQFHIDHPEVARARSEKMRGRKETAEHKAKISKGMKKYRESHLEVTEAQRQAWARHADIKRKMSEIAKTQFPYLGHILAKRRNGGKLTENDLNYEKCYYGVCEREIPGFRSVVAKTYKSLLDELNNGDD